MKTLIQVPFDINHLNHPNYHIFNGLGKRMASVRKVNGDILNGVTEGGITYTWNLDGTIIDGFDEDNLIMFTWDEEPSKEILLEGGILRVLSGGEADTVEEIQPSISFYRAPKGPYSDADANAIISDETEKDLLIRLIWDSTDSHLRNIRDHIELHNILVIDKPIFLYKYGCCNDYYQNIISLLGAIKQNTSPLSDTVIIELYKALDKCLRSMYAENYPISTDRIGELSNIELQTYVVVMDLVNTALLTHEWDVRIYDIITELNSRSITEDNDDNELDA